MVIETKFYCDIDRELVAAAVARQSAETDLPIDYEFAYREVCEPKNLLYFAMTQHDDHSDPNADPEEYIDWVIEECVLDM